MALALMKAQVVGGVTMTIVRIISIFPGLEHAVAMRSLLSDRVSSTPGTSLSINVLGEMPTFVETSTFDSLEAYEKDRDTLAANPNVIEGRNQIGTMSRQPVVVRLLDTIINPLEPRGSNIRYNLRAVIFPTPGGQDTVQAAMEDFTQAQQAAGRVHLRMAQVLFPHDGAAFTIGDSFETMAELENVARSRAAAVSDFRAKIANSVRDPAVYRISEVIVPAN